VEDKSLLPGDGEIYYVTAKGGLWLRDEPSIESNKIKLLPYAYPVYKVKIQKITDTIDGIADHWVIVNPNWGTGQWAFGGYLSKTMPTKELNEIPVMDNYCLKFNKKTFPEKFQSGCIGGGTCINYYGEKDSDPSNRSGQNIVALYKNGKGIIKAHTIEDRTDFKDIKWKKENDKIIITGLYKNREPLFNDEESEKKWRQEQVDIFGKVDFYIDFTVEITVNDDGSYNSKFHAIDNKPITGKKIAEFNKLDNDWEQVGKYDSEDFCIHPI
jgi:hypothetical protein